VNDARSAASASTLIVTVLHQQLPGLQGKAVPQREQDLVLG